MLKIGLKLWSVNKNYINEAIRLYDEGFCDYIELFAVPNSFNDYCHLWKNINIPYVIHAPHFDVGMNLAKRDCLKNNVLLAQEAFKFADVLGADAVIFHSGIGGTIEETAYQLKQIKDSRILIENKPYYGRGRDKKELLCNGYSPQDIKLLIEATGVGFCLDIGHAIYAANAIKDDKIEYIKAFLTLKPRMFHITDGDWAGVCDKHEHLGKGSFDFKLIVQLLPPACMMTVESVHDYQTSLRDFEVDVVTLKKLALQGAYPLAFKRVDEQDIVDLYVLANDPAVRMMSFNSQPIQWDEHVAWVRGRIGISGCFFYIVRDNQQNLVGQVRFDRNDGEDTYVISISLAKKFRGLGLGPRVIKEAIEKLSLDTQGSWCSIIALIKQENLASLKTFERVGFVMDGYQTINDCYAYKMKYTVL